MTTLLGILVLALSIALVAMVLGKKTKKFGLAEGKTLHAQIDGKLENLSGKDIGVVTRMVTGITGVENTLEAEAKAEIKLAQETVAQLKSTLENAEGMTAKEIEDLQRQIAVLEAKLEAARANTDAQVKREESRISETQKIMDFFA